METARRLHREGIVASLYRDAWYFVEMSWVVNYKSCNFCSYYLLCQWINDLIALSSDLCNCLFSARESVSIGVFGGNIVWSN